MSKITLDQVDKVFSGGVTAVNHLDLEIGDGEFMVLIGPSGCGKSTVLRMIAGLEQVTHGTIRIGDRLVNDLAPKDRDIAMVFQNYALYPHMTVAENLAFGLRMRKTPKDELERRVRDAAKILDLEPYLARKPSALSGGQRQRVAMGRAIVREPQAFLMDEPLSNLDAKLRVSMRASLEQLHTRLNVTTVYVTHDQVEAMTLGDRVCVLREGLLQQVDTPQNLYQHPINLFVAGFLGSPAMNIVTAHLVSDGDGAAATFAGFRLPIPQEVMNNRPTITDYIGHDVILGIRPSDFEETRHADPAWAPMTVIAHVTEALGDEIHVIFMIDAPPVEHKDVTDLTPNDKEDHAAVSLLDGKTLWTARVNARATVRTGEKMTLGVDTLNLHFFDPQSGLAIPSLRQTSAIPASDPPPDLSPAADTAPTRDAPLDTLPATDALVHSSPDQ
jgi:multiple sugar transport system ATP-binding protein